MIKNRFKISVHFEMKIWEFYFLGELGELLFGEFGELLFGEFGELINS